MFSSLSELIVGACADSTETSHLNHTMKFNQSTRLLCSGRSRRRMDGKHGLEDDWHAPYWCLLMGSARRCARTTASDASYLDDCDRTLRRLNSSYASLMTSAHASSLGTSPETHEVSRTTAKRHASQEP
ncbi:hypothetical protein L226DRAFT_539323 [Lentinus tigrinus ALCF2SS1-7]|uniref:Uncharacterized protein n=1 Tax=Lentinus tigrinus ALCF2SS1-6 TaxID=1328759 RepID=A0A5C2RV41_9APHY|nr:hypothetical protein L227DRAFT_580238 [Lentinus tigrinus ALCF2SS1-6]RPD69885.1 hypothetical protein L226DRAFT_539323 [Lentinus tigrinus ALCF2SS1-7]